MSNLQKVVLGTPPKGDDGDTVRVANVKANANVDVLNAQATLSSAKDTITAPQALTVADHLGKRVNIALAGDGAVNPPPASKCAADSVILMRNIGTTVVSLPASVGSGDTVALSKLNPGETALIDTDGIHAWTVLMRGRTNGDNETVNGNCAVAGDETVGGALNVVGKATVGGTLAVGDLLTAGAGVALPDGTSIVTAVTAPVFQCYLSQSGTGLVLSRKSGSYVTIQGIARQIPAAGVTLAATSVAANTLYYIYAYMSGKNMALEASTTARAVDATTGVDVKSGDSTRTLVGMVYTTAANSFAAVATAGLFTPINCLSFHNRKLRVTSAINDNGQAQVDTVWLSAIVANWADEPIEASAVGSGSTPTSGNTSLVYIAYNGNGLGKPQRYSNINGGYSFPVGFEVAYPLAEGAYAWQLRGLNDGQLLTMSAAFFVKTRG
ncbi:hypothetical protein [Paraburkholderia agricolaris]|uniref:hypothetical protein n=1 Tax=Paraburkholderia agricolaris TaxID=2152888 RepID=UPI001290C964|nr:hypothetical protein [Paraburkholderia agricolaris]